MSHNKTIAHGQFPITQSMDPSERAAVGKFDRQELGLFLWATFLVNEAFAMVQCGVSKLQDFNLG